MTPGAPHILLAEDDWAMRNALKWWLEREGYRVTDCHDGLSLLDHLTSCLLGRRDPSYDLVVADIQLPGATGMDVLEAANQMRGRPPIILMTAFGDDDTHKRAKELGAAQLLDKPFDLLALLAAIAAHTR